MQVREKVDRESRQALQGEVKDSSRGLSADSDARGKSRKEAG